MLHLSFRREQFNQDGWERAIREREDRYSELETGAMLLNDERIATEMLQRKLGTVLAAAVLVENILIGLGVWPWTK